MANLSLGRTSDGKHTPIKVDADGDLQLDVLTISAGTNTIGGVNPVAVATGGASAYRSLNLLATGLVVKAAAGKLLSLHVWNGHATDLRYLKVYDKATAATEADTPVFTIPLKALVLTPVELPLTGADFAAGISLRAVTELADNGTTAPGANEIVVNATYK